MILQKESVIFGSSLICSTTTPTWLPGRQEPTKLQIAADFNAGHFEDCECCVPTKSSLKPGFWKKVGLSEQACDFGSLQIKDRSKHVHTFACISGCMAVL